MIKKTMTKAKIMIASSIIFSLFQGSIVLPAHAQSLEPMEIYSIISNPKYSALICDQSEVCTPSESTSISYVLGFKPVDLQEVFNFSSSDACTTDGGDSPCAVFTVQLTDASLNNPHEAWNSLITPADIQIAFPSGQNYFGDIIVGEVNTYDTDLSGSLDQLEITIDCNGDCNFSEGILIIDILNGKLFTPVTLNPPYISASDSFISTVQLNRFAAVVAPGVNGYIGQTSNNYSTPISVSLNVEPRLEFSIEGNPIDTEFGEDESSNVESDVDGCNFGTLAPSVPKVCVWNMEVSTNAKNGFYVLVRQDENMVKSSGDSGFDQFNSGEQLTANNAIPWSSPTGESRGHLGYSSTQINEEIGDGQVVWAGIPNLLSTSEAPSTMLLGGEEVYANGLVAVNFGPGDYNFQYALKIESTSAMPQASTSIGQSYSHNQFFIIVPNF